VRKIPKDAVFKIQLLQLSDLDQLRRLLTLQRRDPSVRNIESGSTENESEEIIFFYFLKMLLCYAVLVNMLLLIRLYFNNDKNIFHHIYIINR